MTPIEEYSSVGVFYFGGRRVSAGTFVKHQHNQRGTRKRESGTDLLSRIQPEVRERLDVELLRVEDALALMPALLPVKQKGVHVRILLPLGHDPGFPGRLWDLDPHIREGIDIRWGPTVFKERLMADGRHAYRLNGKAIVPDPELAQYPLARAAGTIEIFSGEVVDRRTREPGLSQLDRLLFVRIWALGGQFPIYFSSVRTSVDVLRSGTSLKCFARSTGAAAGCFRPLLLLRSTTKGLTSSRSPVRRPTRDSAAQPADEVHRLF